MTPDPRPPAAAGPGSERLQLLLARAAEEQLSEQRQVSALLAELQGLVVDLGERVGDRLDGVEARLDALGVRVDELGGRVDATASAMTAALTDLVQSQVRAAVADSERRLAAHVDEAVLALAGVLLRRARGVQTGAAVTPASPGAESQRQADPSRTHGGADPHGSGPPCSRATS